ncbi:MAG TPA: leucine-rich repeat protein [Clostridiales bacterium]|nr:leucine-rich repeat protein [Clostridiales bacterium]
MRGKVFPAILLAVTLLMMMKAGTTYAYVGSAFQYTNEGQTISYKVLSEPTGTENGRAQVIYSEEINKKLSGDVVIPATVTNSNMTYDVVELSSSAFRGASGITRMTLPETVTAIGEDAFINCTGLKNVNIPGKVTRIENSTFNGCSSLENIYLPNGITYIGDMAFQDCIKLSAMNLPDKLTSIGLNAFNNCSKLTDISMPKGVTSIGPGAFAGCSSITSVTIPEGVTSIGNAMFRDCTSLTYVSLPESLTQIGSSAFYNCSSLKNIHIPDAVTNIGSHAFYQCTSLTSIKIPYYVKSIGDFTFFGCNSLAKVRIQDNVTAIGNYAFFNCKSLTSVELPEGLESIGNWAFYGCDSLRPLQIPSGVTGIGYGEFPYAGVLVYKNSFAEDFFRKNQPEYYQIVKLPLEEMSFAEAVMNLAVNGTVSLKPVFYPTFSSDIATISWSSSNEAVLTVDSSGKVKGVGAGEADVTATMGKYSATCHIIVGGAAVNPTSIEFKDNNVSLKKGESTKLSLDFAPANSTNRSVTWKSSNNSVVTVEQGRIYAKGNGTATITATTGTAAASCKVTVYSPLKELFSDYDRITLYKGESKKLVISYDPMDTTDDKTVSWTSGDEAIVKVVNGALTAVRSGKTTVTAKVGVLTHSIPVTVLSPTTSLELAQKEISLIVGQAQQLQLTVLPADATDEITGTSSDESVATFSNGSITALKRGKATITVRSGSVVASCVVNVSSDIKGITLSKQSLTLYLGSSQTLTAAFNPTDAKDDRTVTWTSSDKSIITIDSKGKIKTVGTGTATVTATAGDGVQATCSVAVKLSTPGSIKAVSGGHNSAKITWGAVSGASGYEVYRSGSKTGKYVKVKETTARSFTDTGLTTGSTYYYKVMAYRSQGAKKVYGSGSAVASVKPIPATPGNTKLVKVKSGTAKFTWNKVSGASGYEVYRTSSLKEPYRLTKTTTSLHFINYGLTKGKTYYYKVRTYKIVGKKKVYSPFSTVYSVKM